MFPARDPPVCGPASSIEAHKSGTDFDFHSATANLLSHNICAKEKCKPLAREPPLLANDYRLPHFPKTVSPSWVLLRHSARFVPPPPEVVWGGQHAQRHRADAPR